MRKFCFISIIAILFFSCTNSKKSAKEHLAKATEFFKKEDYSNALKEADAAFKLDSTNYDIQILKAKIYSESNQDEDAIKILSALNSKHFKEDTVNFLIGKCYFSRGIFYTQQKDDSEKKVAAFENAIKYFESGIRINSQYYHCYIGNQKSLHNLEKYDEALITLNTASQLFPDSMYLTYSRGVEKIYLGDNIGAMSDLNSSIRSNKLDSIDLATAYRFRGIIYSDKGNYEEAISDLTIAISYNLEDELAYLARAGVYLEKGSKDLACQDYRKCADLGYVAVYKFIQDYCGN